ncbi:MAG: hypothetical protein AMJ69_03615 [Gammaproteobacteria bacterium SG8_47]|nr:MAG: hypothetical protein AMJ69_03615 [Gammaproteobacteria bacterium SG8_47]
MGLLDELKQQAEAKKQQEAVERAEQERLIEHAHTEVKPRLARVYTYLSELAEHLNYVQPEIFVSYDIKNGVVLENLRQRDYKVRADSREQLTEFSLTFHCVDEGKLEFEVESKPQIDRRIEFLQDNKLSFTRKEIRDDRLNVSHALFRLEREVPIVFHFKLAADLLGILMTIRNFETLGLKTYALDPARIDDSFLEELGRYILRKDTKFLQLDMSESDRARLRALVAAEKQQQAKTTAEQAKAEQTITQAAATQHEATAANSPATSATPPPSPSEAETVKAEIPPKPADLRDATLYTEFAHCPNPYRKPGRADLARETYVKKLGSLKMFPTQQVQEAARSASALNAVVMKWDKRLELATAILAASYATVAQFYGHYQSRHSAIPEDRDQRDTLTATINLAEQLAIAYKLVFKELFATARGAYLKHRDTLVEAGFRALEMSRLAQRLRAIRYQKLPGAMWSDCNRIFFGLALHNDTAQPLRLTGTTGVRPVSEKRSPGSSTMSSPQDVYLSVQLFGLLDTITWPMRLLHVPDAYLNHLDNALRILPDSAQGMAPGTLITYLDADGPPRFQRREQTHLPAIRVEYSTLFNRLAQDHEALSQMKVLDHFDPTKVSTPLAHLAGKDRIPVVELMLLRLKERQRQHKRHAGGGNESFRLYFGFDDGHQLLQAIAAPYIEGALQKRNLTDNLAQRSAKFTDDQEQLATRWQLVDFSTGGLLLRTQVTAFTTPVEIGQIVTFSPVDKLEQALIGYICRLHRPRDDEIEVAITRVAKYAEAALVQEALGEEAARPVILIQDLDEHWRVIAPADHGYVSGTPLKVTQPNGRTVPARLGNVWLAKNDFTVFELSSPGFDRVVKTEQAKSA